METIVLASDSKIRRQLLVKAGVRVVSLAADLDEHTLIEHRSLEDAREIAVHLAEAKARAVSTLRPGAIVIGADQTLEIDGQYLTKPADLVAARRQIKSLSGRTHALHSAFAIVKDGKRLARQIRTARLTMRPLGDDEIDNYLDAVGPVATTSVGAYQLEGLGIRLFARIEGDYFTILGLPMIPLLVALRRIGALAL